MDVKPTEQRSTSPQMAQSSDDQASHEYVSLSHVNMNTTQLASEQRLINRADIFVNKKKERSSQGISNENSV